MYLTITVNLIILALHVNWKLLNILTDDNKLINLIADFGDPFPKAGNILASKSYDDDSTSTLGSVIKYSQESKSDYSNNVESLEHVGTDYSSSERGNVEALDVANTDNEDKVCLEGDEIVDEKEQDSFIRIHLEAHEGDEASNSPFNVFPKQMVCKLLP